MLLRSFGYHLIAPSSLSIRLTTRSLHDIYCEGAMRILFSLAIVALISNTPSSAAPALSDKPKWEYAELYYRVIPGRPRGVDADGNEVPAVPASAAIRLTTSGGDLEAKSWFDLAEKLKATGIKKDSSTALQKIQVLNS